MEFFNETLRAICESDPAEKGELVEQLYTNLRQNRLTFDHDSPVKRLERPSYAQIVTIVRPRDVPKRKHFDKITSKTLLSRISSKPRLSIYC
jgi:uncharacterized ferritin-like protein (DUF455 family)